MLQLKQGQYVTPILILQELNRVRQISSDNQIKKTGSALVRYLFYPNGRVMTFAESGNNPFRLETEEDLDRLISFLGKVRDRLAVFSS